MALRKRKPTSPGRRFQTVSDFSEITDEAREVTARAPTPAPADATTTAGSPRAIAAVATNSSTARSISGAKGRGARQGRHDRIRPQPHLPHRPDPLPRRREGYILAPKDLHVGDTVQAGQGSEIRPATLPLRYIPVGTTVHNVEMKPGGGGKLARSAGVEPARGEGRRLRHPQTSRRPRCDGCRSTAGEPWEPSETPSTN